MSNTHADSHTADHAHADGHAEGDVHVHVVPIKVLLGVFALLMVLTALTVAVRFIDLGPYNVWLAMFIALIKAAFVCLYFMHLRYDKPFHSVILLISMLFVVLFICITIVDSAQYAPLSNPPAQFGAAP